MGHLGDWGSRKGDGEGQMDDPNATGDGGIYIKTMKTKWGWSKLIQTRPRSKTGRQADRQTHPYWVGWGQGVKVTLSGRLIWGK